MSWRDWENLTCGNLFTPGYPSEAWKPHLHISTPATIRTIDWLIDWLLQLHTTRFLFLTQSTQQNPSPLSTAEFLPFVNRNPLCMVTTGTTVKPRYFTPTLPCSADSPCTKTCYESLCAGERPQHGLDRIQTTWMRGQHTNHQIKLHLLEYYCSM